MNPNMVYAIYRAQQPQTRAAQLAADTNAGQLAKAIAELCGPLSQSLRAAGRLSTRASRWAARLNRRSVAKAGCCPESATTGILAK